MFLGRPTNLWLGAFTAILGAVVLVLAALQPPVIIPAPSLVRWASPSER